MVWYNRSFNWIYIILIILRIPFLRNSLHKWPGILNFFYWFHFRRVWFVERAFERYLRFTSIRNLREVFFVNLWSWVIVFVDLCPEICLTEWFWSHIFVIISHTRQSIMWSIMVSSSKRSNMVVINLIEVAVNRCLFCK